MRAAIDGDVGLQIPEFAYLEIANALLQYVRAGTLTAEAANEELDYVLDVPAERVPGNRLAKQALALGVARRLSAYDGAYLALALGTDSVLVTADRRLAAEAERRALLPDDGPPV